MQRPCSAALRAIDATGSSIVRSVEFVLGFESQGSWQTTSVCRTDARKATRSRFSSDSVMMRMRLHARLPDTLIRKDWDNFTFI